MLTIYLKYLLYLEIFLSLAKPVPNDSVVVNKTKKPLIYAKVGNVTRAVVFHAGPLSDGCSSYKAVQ